MHTLFKYIADNGDSDDRPVVATIPVNIWIHHSNIVIEINETSGETFCQLKPQWQL